MTKRTGIHGLLLALAVALLATTAVAAQDAADETAPPAVIALAVQDLSTRLGVPISLDDIAQWTWSGHIYDDTSLGCPQPGQTYAQAQTRGFRFLLTYLGQTYDYRVSASGDTVIPCEPGAVDGAPEPEVPVEPAPTPVIPDPIDVDPGATGANCAGALDSRLEAGSFAQMVLDRTPLNVRAAPSLTAERVGRIAPGEVVSVLAGPSCGANNIAWWQIDLGAASGWAAEGQGTVYFLRPVVQGEGDSGDLPGPTDGTAVILCTGGLPSRLAVGAFVQARLNLSAPLNVRDAATLTGGVIDQVPRGEVVPVLDGPTCGPDGLTWWQVQTGDVTGWAAEASGGIYLMDPIAG